MLQRRKEKTDKSNTSKYKAVRTGIFRSRIEERSNQILSESGLEFCYECKHIILLDKFTYEGKNYRELKYIPDFIVTHDNIQYYIEIKGFETPEFKLKWKLLNYYLYNNIEKYGDVRLVLIKNLKELNTFINERSSN